MKTIITAIVLSLSTLIVSAQPQRSNFKQLLSYGETPINANTIIPFLTMDPNNGLTAEEAQRYGHEQLLNDMHYVFLPYYRPVLSHDDITFILAVFHSPEVRNALRHMEFLNMSPTEERGKMLAPQFSKIMAGEKPDPITLKEGISQEYLEACTAYYLESGQAEGIAQLKNSIGNHSDTEGAKKFAKIVDYLIAYNPTLIANVSYGKISIDDFKIMTTLYQTKPFQDLKAGNKALSAKSHEVTAKLMEMAKQWKEKKKAAE